MVVAFAVPQFFIGDLKFNFLVRIGLGALVGVLVVAFGNLFLLISQGKDQEHF